MAATSSDTEVSEIVIISVMKKDIECPVCLGFIFDPFVADQCGHSVCVFCYKTLKSCPTCRKRVNTWYPNWEYMKFLHRYFEKEYEKHYEERIAGHPELWTLPIWRSKYPILSYDKTIFSNERLLLHYLQKCHMFIEKNEFNCELIEQIFGPSQKIMIIKTTDTQPDFRGYRMHQLSTQSGWITMNSYLFNIYDPKML